MVVSRTVLGLGAGLAQHKSCHDLGNIVFGQGGSNGKSA